MTRRWSETRLHDGSNKPPVTEGRVRFYSNEDGHDVSQLYPEYWEGVMAYQVELPPEPLIEGWQLQHKTLPYCALYFSQSAAEEARVMESRPDDWRIVHMREVRE